MFRRAHFLLGTVLLAIVVPLLIVNAERPSGSSVDMIAARVQQEFRTTGASYPEFYIEPTLRMRYKITTYTGEPTRFPITVDPGTEAIGRLAFDFDRDGFVDWETGDPDTRSVTHTFETAGKYEALFIAFDAYGRTYQEVIPVEVVAGIGAPRMEKNPIKFTFNKSALKGRRSESALTDTARNYFLLIGSTSRFWDDVHDAYEKLQDSFGYTDDDIILVAGNPWNRYEYIINDPEDTVWIDHIWSDTGLQAAFDSLIVWMTPDDDLHMLYSGHGSGYPNQDAATYGDTAYVWPYVGFNSYYDDAVYTPGDPELDQLESEFRWLYSKNSGLLNDSRGMNEWRGGWTPGGDAGMIGDYIGRSRLVTTFDTATFYNGTWGDTDIYVETISQYFKGDFDHDHCVDETDSLDWDGDGNMPIDTSGGVYIYDEDDWGDSTFFNDYPEFFNTGDLVLWDQGYNGTLEIDYNCSDVSNPQVDASDSDDDGLLVGMDFNGDADLTDSVGINETFSFLGVDDNLGEFLDSLDYAHVAFINLACFSGGSIDDMSRDHVLIATGTTQGTISYNNSFTEHMRENLCGSIPDGGDRVVTYKNAYDSLDVLGGNGGRERLDDNGDQIGHVYLLPNGGDGALADSLSWGTLEFVPPPPYGVAPAGDSTIIDDLTPIFTWSDSGSCDSFQVSIFPSNTMFWFSARTTDTAFSFPDSLYLRYMPMDYYWYVRAYRGHATSSLVGPTHFYLDVNDTCCNGDGLRGNVNMDVNDALTIGDLTLLGDFLFGTHAPLPCWTEANYDGSSNEVPDSAGDYMGLYNHIFYSGADPDSCGD